MRKRSLCCSRTDAQRLTSRGGRHDNFIPMPSDDFQSMGPPVGISGMFLAPH
jgi:hypothetical protein